MGKYRVRYVLVALVVCSLATGCTSSDSPDLAIELLGDGVKCARLTIAERGVEEAS